VSEPCQPPDGQLLRAAGYSAAAIAERAARVRGVPPALHAAAFSLALDDADPLDRLIRRFHLGDGLLIGEVDGLYVAYDRDVAPPSESMLYCAALVPPLRVRRALDLGTGTGLQALRMARHAQQVVATDVSEHALRFARLNAELNGITNLELRQGDWLEPVAGERFGLVVCNAPYVVSPDATVVYRDSGRGDDGLSRMLLRALPDLLEEGGYGVLQGNWIHAEDERWWRPIADDLAGCDAWLCRMATRSPLQYAATWADDEATMRRWFASYAGIGAITSAMVVVRKRAAPEHWRLAVTMRDRPQGLGERLPALAAVHDRLDELADAPLRRAPGLDVERRNDRAVLHLDASFEVRRPVSLALAHAVLALDGHTPAPELAPLLKLGFVEFALR
jgi:SAM-dependent methyltransferase